jgi:flagellar assembly factor FliW
MSAGVSLTEHEAMLAVESELLGSFSVPTDSTFTFADGILGFPEARRFVLIPAERDGFFWLQSTEFGALAFLVADPFPIVPEFSVELTDAEVKMLEPTDGAELAVLAIVTLPRDHDHAPLDRGSRRPRHRGLTPVGPGRRGYFSARAAFFR